MTDTFPAAGFRVRGFRRIPALKTRSSAALRRILSESGFGTIFSA